MFSLLKLQPNKQTEPVMAKSKRIKQFMKCKL